MQICVLGGGVIGAATAYYLTRDGHAVTLIEKDEGVGLETSYANGGQLSYNYVAPLADPSVLPKLPAWLFTRESPLRFTPRLEPQQWRWGFAFLRACTAETARTGTADLLALGLYSRALIHELLDGETLDFDYRQNGKLVVYRDPAEFEGAKRQMELQAALGTEQRALDAKACVALEPALATIGPKLCGGIHTPSEDVGDCHKFTRALVHLAQEKGARLLLGCVVAQLVTAGGRVVAVRTNLGDITADHFVVALGMESRALLRPLGIHAPLYPITGYSLTAPADAPHRPPRISITDAHHKIVYALLGDRLRAAGMADLTGLHPKPNAARLDLLIRQARETFPDACDFAQAATWFGQRPATPTGKPIVSDTDYDNLWLNIGHGALGFTLAAASAKLMADSIAGRTPAVAMDAYALD
jgi:D-amino-acid dehydrogenase